MTKEFPSIYLIFKVKWSYLNRHNVKMELIRQINDLRGSYDVKLNRHFASISINKSSII